MPKKDYFIRGTLQQFEEAVTTFARDLMRERGEAKPIFTVIASKPDLVSVWFYAGQNTDNEPTGEITAWRAKDGAMLTVVTPGDFPRLEASWSLLHDHLEHEGFIVPGSDTWHKGNTLYVTQSSASLLELPDGTPIWAIKEDFLRDAIERLATPSADDEQDEIYNRSGGVAINANTVNIYGDVVGHDKIDSSADGRQAIDAPPNSTTGIN